MKLTETEARRVLQKLREGQVYYFSHYQEMEERTTWVDGEIHRQYCRIDVAYTSGWAGVTPQVFSEEEFVRQLTGRARSWFAHFLGEG